MSILRVVVDCLGLEDRRRGDGDRVEKRGFGQKLVVAWCWKGNWCMCA